MIAPIVTPVTDRYGARMRIAAIRLLALVAVLLIPFGMAAAPAATAVQHHASAAMERGHCPEPASQDSTADVGHQCAMPCSAALPAAGISSVGVHPVARTPAIPVPDRTLSGVEMEIATPPPKLS